MAIPPSANFSKSGPKQVGKKSIVLLLVLLGIVGGGLFWLWNRAAPDSSQGVLSGTEAEQREALHTLLEKYLQTGHFEQAFSLLNQAIQENPNDKALQQELERVLAAKQAADQQRQQTEEESQSQLIEGLQEQNIALQQKSDKLYRQLSDQLDQQKDQGNTNNQAQVSELLAEAEAALKAAQAGSQNAGQTKADQLALVRQARQKALQALALQSDSAAAQRLLTQAEKALQDLGDNLLADSESDALAAKRQGSLAAAAKSQEKSPTQEAKSAEEADKADKAEKKRQELAQLQRELRQARAAHNAAATDRIVAQILAREPADSNANTAKARRIVEDVAAHRRGASLPQAERAYRQALASSPQHEEALAGLAENLAAQGRLKEAVAAYDAALRKRTRPFDDELAYAKGIALYKLGRYREAVSSLQSYLQQGGKNLRAYYALGLSQQRLGRVPQAQKAYQQAIAKGLKHGPSHWELAKLQLAQSKGRDSAQGPLTAALQNVDAALRLTGSDDVRYMQTKGAVLYQLRRYDEAAKAYAHVERTAAASKAGFPPEALGQIAYNLGLSYHNSSQHQLAQAALAKAIATGGNKVEYLLALADSQLAAGQRQQAQQTLTKAAQKYPRHAGLLLTQGNLYTQAGQYQKALEVLQRAYQQNPKESKVINNLGLAYLNTERFDESRKFFDQAIKREPGNSALWLNLALVEVATEQHEVAIRHLEKAVSLDKKLSRAYDLLVQEYLVVGQRQQAERALLRLQQVAPRYAKLDELKQLLGQ